ITKLQRLPAGVRLDELEKSGFDKELLQRARDVVARRNALVHHFFEQPGVAKAMTTGDGLEELCGWIDQLTDDSNGLTAEIGVPAFARAEQVLEMSLPELAAQMASRNLDEIKSEELRSQFQMVRDVPPDFFD